MDTAYNILTATLLILLYAIIREINNQLKG